MKKLPAITVVTPSFNQGQFIQQTIDSVLSQNYPTVELIVMDGGSTDNTVEILKSYGKAIKWESKKDKGQSDAINQGMRQASGEIVCYLNSDDMLTPGALAAVGKYFRDTQHALWVTGDYQIIDEQGANIQPFVRHYKTFFRKLSQPWLLYILNYINQPSTFWRKSVFKEIGYFDESLRYCMDYDFWLRLTNKQAPGLIDQPLSQFRIHSLSKGGSQYRSQFAEEQLVAKRYSANPVLSTLHALHSAVTVRSYDFIK